MSGINIFNKINVLSAAINQRELDYPAHEPVGIVDFCPICGWFGGMCDGKAKQDREWKLADDFKSEQDLAHLSHLKAQFDREPGASIDFFSSLAP